MAIDKSKENSRIADLLAMSTDAVNFKIIMGIKNPSILKHYATEGIIKWEYAVAAGLLERSDVEWIKEHINEGDSEG